MILISLLLCLSRNALADSPCDGEKVDCKTCTSSTEWLQGCKSCETDGTCQGNTDLFKDCPNGGAWLGASDCGKSKYLAPKMAPTPAPPPKGCNGQKYAKCGDCTSQSERWGLDSCDWCVSDGRCHSSSDIFVKGYFCAGAGWVSGDKCPSTPLPSLSAVGCNGQVYAKCSDCTSQAERFGVDRCEWCPSDGRCHSSSDILLKRYQCAAGWIEADACPATTLKLTTRAPPGATSTPAGGTTVLCMVGKGYNNTSTQDCANKCVIAEIKCEATVPGCKDGYILEQSCRDDNFCSQLAQDPDYKPGGVCCRSNYCNNIQNYKPDAIMTTQTVTARISRAASLSAMASLLVVGLAFVVALCF